MKLYIKIEYKILILGILDMVAISMLVNGISYTNAIAFFLFQIYGIVVPGMAFMTFFDFNVFTRLERILMCYVSGYILNIIIYLITIPFHLNKFIWFPILVCFLISLCILYKSKTQIINKNSTEIEEKIAIVVVSILFLFSLICFSGRWSVPKSANTYNNDLMYWIGDIITLKEKFLPDNMRNLQANYRYHYFGAMQQAVVSIFSITSAFETAVYWSSIESSIILGLASSCLTFRIIKDVKIGIFTLGLLLFSTGLEEKSIVTYIWHIHLMPMSFNIALAFGMIIMLLIVIQEDLEKINWQILILLVLSMAICTGTKGPVGAITLCGVGIVCLYWMFSKRDYKKAFVYGCATLVAFGVIYCALLADTNRLYEVRSDGGTVEENYENAECVVPPNKNDMWNSLLEILRTFKGYVAYGVYMNPWTVIPSFLLIVYELIYRKKNILHLAMAGMIIIGIVLGKNILYIGASQMYFSMSVFPFAAILTGKALEYILIARRNKKLENICGVLLAITMCIVFKYSINWTYGDDLRASIHIGWSNLTHKPYKVWGGGSLQEVSVDEYNAYLWLRENTTTDTAALIDPSLEATENGYICRVFSERFIYFYRDINDMAELKEYMENVYKDKQKDIKYIIQNRESSDIPEVLLAQFVSVYENDKVVIYYIE